MNEEKKTVLLPVELYRRIEDRLKATGFSTVEEYITFVLEEILTEERKEDTAIGEQEEEEVKKRLKSLGYLD